LPTAAITACRSASAAEGGVEFRILVELEGVDDGLGQLRRLEDLDFGVDRAGVRRQAGQDGLGIDDLLRARVDHDVGGRRVHRRLPKHHEHQDGGDHPGHGHEQPQATPERGDQAFNIDGLARRPAGAARQRLRINTVFH
jgi:hypothetical protein